MTGTTTASVAENYKVSRERESNGVKKALAALNEAHDALASLCIESSVRMMETYNPLRKKVKILYGEIVAEILK